MQDRQEKRKDVYQVCPAREMLLFTALHSNWEVRRQTFHESKQEKTTYTGWPELLYCEEMGPAL